MKTKALSMLFLLTGLVALGQDDHHHHHHEESKAVEQGPTAGLSPEVRALLVEEMQQLDKAMSALSPEISSGNWSRISEIAAQMRDSFILKKKLTPEQGKELHGKLSEAFIERDRAFHTSAGRLVEAAEQHNGELTAFYFYRLMEGCVGCHAKYAPQRFPSLRKSM